MVQKRLSLVHATGNPNSRNAALAFGECGLLHEIVTTIAYDPQNANTWLKALLPKGIRNRVTHELKRRTWEAPDGARICSHPGREIIRLSLTRTGIAQRWHFGQKQLIDWVNVNLDEHAATQHLSGLDAIYAYEDGAATTFRAAKLQGIRCFYDLPTMFYGQTRKIHAEEAALFPELASTMVAVNEPAWKLRRKELEVQLADHIFVASTGTRNSLLEAGIDAAKISIIPYGAPVDYFQPHLKEDDLFRAIFVGLISPRKGVHYLLQAWQELGLPKAELLLVGSNQFPSRWLSQHSDCMQHVPSVPHHALNPYYSNSNVLVFPSLVEGFGMVILEAMACGTPVITTPNTGGPDLLTDGVEGFIVPIRDVDALKERLEWCYQYPQDLAEMGRAARRRAEELTWEMYRKNLATNVQGLLR